MVGLNFSIAYCDYCIVFVILTIQHQINHLSVSLSLTQIWSRSFLLCQ